MTDYRELRQFLTRGSESGELTYSENSPLSSCCTFKIGGNADFIIYPSTERCLSELIALLRASCIRHDIFGNASNVLFDDNGYRGAVIFTAKLCALTRDGNTLTAGCGLPLTSLAVTAQRYGLSGLEFSYGIPGSVGGAVFMNAGAYSGEIGDVCVESRALEQATGEIYTLRGKEQRFGYRESAFMANGNIILSSVFALKEADPEAIRSAMDALIARRIEKQPLEYPSAGSVFKRCNGYFTAKLIEEAGLKGAREGGAQVSEKHAGFIVNLGSATSSDVIKLIERIKSALHEKNGIDIQPEIRIIPA